VYQFNLASGGKTTSWTVDIKNAPGSVKQGAAAKADCTLSTSEEDFIGMMTGKLNSQQLFMQGKLKVFVSYFCLLMSEDRRKHGLGHEIEQVATSQGITVIGGIMLHFYTINKLMMQPGIPISLENLRCLRLLDCLHDHLNLEIASKFLLLVKAVSLSFHCC
jgi:hypothetical protein